MRRHGISGALAAFAVALCSGPVPVALAQPTAERTAGSASDLAGSNGADRPWADGVSPAAQAAAKKLFEQGNDHLSDSLFSKAIESYRAALERWDHPAIQFNLALALENLDRPLAQREALKRATEYGVDPLDEAKYASAQQKLERLETKQLARLEVTCDVSGAAIIVGSQRVATCPKTYSVYVEPAEYTIIATKPGYVKATETRRLFAGQHEVVELKLYTEADLTGYRRRWHPRTPWIWVGSGLAAGAIGGTLLWRATANLSAFDQAIADCGGCEPDAEMSALRDRGNLYSTLSIITLGVGAATAATGLVMVIMNRPKSYRLDVEGQTSAQSNALTIVPIIGDGTIGVQAAFRL
jgi:hypothetical protein